MRKGGADGRGARKGRDQVIRRSGDEQCGIRRSEDEPDVPVSPNNGVWVSLEVPPIHGDPEPSSHHLHRRGRVWAGVQLGLGGYLGTHRAALGNPAITTGKSRVQAWHWSRRNLQDFVVCVRPRPLRVKCNGDHVGLPRLDQVGHGHCVILLVVKRTRGDKGGKGGAKDHGKLDVCVFWVRLDGSVGAEGYQ